MRLFYISEVARSLLPVSKEMDRTSTLLWYHGLEGNYCVFYKIMFSYQG